MFGEVVHQQAGHLELVDEAASLVRRPRSVGVPVEQQAEVVAVAGQHPERLVDVRLDRLGVDPAEVGIALLVDLGDADLPAAQKARQPAGTGAPHRLDQHVDVRGAQGVQVDRPSQEALVARKGVEAFDPSGGLRVGERPLLDVAAAVLGNRRLENLEDLRPGRGAAGRLDLEAVVGPRVVAGRDDDAGCRSPLDHLVRRHLRRHRVDGVGDRDVACQQDFGRSDGEVIRGEPAVVGDDHAFRLLALLFDVASNTVGAPADVLESELVRDPSPPAVRCGRTTIGDHSALQSDAARV